MEPGPPDSKRQRLASWPSTPQQPQPVSLPRPHPGGNPLPPPRATNHPPPPPPTYQPYTSRPPEQPHSTAATPPAHHQPPPPPPPPQHPDPERRHHEQEPYAPMQDHYQHHHHHPQQQQQQQHPHPHSPAHNHYQPQPPYPPRDPPGVKRETDDNRRPNSTGHAGGPAGSAPHPHALPPPPYETQHRHMNYDNGHSVPPTPGGYRGPAYPAPPTPIQQQAPYEPHPSYPPSQPESFYSVYSSSVPAKKKNTRASQACDQCRQLKAKCDETKPCKTCRDKGLECRYRDPVPKATDKAQADILEGIAALQASLTTISNNVERMEGRLSRMEDAFPPPANTATTHQRPPKREYEHEHEHHEPINDQPMEPERMPERMPERLPEHVSERMPERMPESDMKVPPPRSPYANGGEPEPYYSHEPQDMNMPGDDRHDHHMRMMADDEVDAEPGPPVPPGEPAIPINHTTLASLLLDWPSIRELTKHHVEREGIKYISEFPIRQEQNRGPLIVYGRGEDGVQARHVDHGTVDMVDEISEPSSPSPGADFGHLGGMSPPDNVEYKGGVLGFDGNPDFSESKVWTYVKSFEENMLNMHPVIQPRMLHAWVRQFLDNLPTVQSKAQKTPAAKPAFAISSNTPTSMANEVTGAKRKRSPEPEGANTTSPSQNREKEAKSGKPRRTLVNAVVLTVLALGKVCLHRDQVPDVVHPPDNQYHGSPASRNGIPPSPSQASPPNYGGHTHSTQQSPHDYPDRGSQSRRPSIHGSNSVRAGFNLKKNYDVIPGLEYFAYASDILGNHMGSYNNLKNVYANVFAGLYMGQLARPLESFAYIHQASHKLQILLRPSLDRLRTFKKNREFIQETKYNQLALAFWTCLQLESDLIAELQLPPSGLLSYEEDMPPPNMLLVTGFSQRVLDSYPGQLYLRKHLNSIHRMFYAPDDPAKAGPDQFRNVDLVADSVSGMHWVAPSFAFREDDPPADEILAARLRAKYWGAQTITYRPFIRQILQFSHSLNHHPTSPNPPTGTEFRDGIIAPMIHPNTKSLGDIEPSVVELARKGIKALVESTRPFHNLGDKRPLITNVFGTAHAQWGNLLVLSAAFRDPVLSAFIDEDLLKTLFHKTIAFLRQSATATSSLRADLGILEGLQRDLFYGPDVRTGSSFSSQPGSAQTPTIPSRPPMHLQRSMSDVNLAPPMGGHSHSHGPYSR